MRLNEMRRYGKEYPINKLNYETLAKENFNSIDSL